MLAEFFDVTKNSRDLFAGLKVAKNKTLCREWINQYSVVSLTLKRADKLTYKEAVESIQNLISEICTLHDEVLENANIKSRDRRLFQKLIDCETNETTLCSSLLTITRVLFQHYNKPVILLIDEYDVPVAKAAERGYYDEMIVFMRGFLSDALKTNPYLKFGILTGALRITKESIFTGLNNLDCFDIANPKYADVFGFTQCEVDQMLFDAGLEEKLDELKAWYDGYRECQVYCVNSVWR